MPRHRPDVLAIVRTDSTFERVVVRGETVWCGKCLHCGARLVVSLTGVLQGATIEHIVPKNHGGTDDLHNLALACARCNHQKGKRLDARPAGDPTLRQVIATLQQRRASRWRDG